MSLRLALLPWLLFCYLLTAGPVLSGEAQEHQKALGLMRLGDHTAAVELLLRQPVSGLQQALLGTAYNRLKNYEQAVVALEQAIALGSTSTAVSTELGYAQMQLGQYGAAQRSLSHATQPHSDDIFANELLARAAALEAGFSPRITGESPFSVWFSSDAGYNDNVLAIADGQALPPGFDDEASPYIGLYLGARYQQQSQDESGFSASYAFSSRFYDEFSELNSQQHMIGARYLARLSASTGLALRTGWNTYLLDADTFRSQASAGLELVHRWNREHRTALSTDYIDSNYKFSPALERLDRDGGRTVARLRHQYLHHQTRLFAELGIGRNDADGDDFDFEEYGIQAGFHHWFSAVNYGVVAGRPVLGVTVAIKEEAYDESSVFQPDTDREDSVFVSSFVLQVPVVNKFSIFVRYDWRDQDSDVDLFNYDQHQYSVGFTRLIN
ncbi:MAG: hypothetical protein NXI15_10735 [Gammaproteobacteria bacterium]|nr:hypothetical protein [Gammaproteobacteria bacterium]